ncbi:metal dependent phosphohydrolase [Gloeocapsa sp. PCC 7428]|uniref:bis(5'-nucleosyl)-tetraphosphatase (symmetrical) YqeK n=1 Tax=Gloeocapsa sp. PCC 7428 TaxID=1173026 RepID=UPI0002A5F579|nr:bis(5'-nucleosyl)-tetraphosphatase (symmetrical) YqeK [Gloeocapsa sp. PCC 7428]AFZ32211.1 metal dependent phosphohydrolase [Gloeocapsa sp. PCC 7428]
MLSDQTLALNTPNERDRILAWLAENVPQSRIQHILRVEQMAIALAHHHRVDVEKAAKAALMHDLAKYFKPQKLLTMAQAEGLEIDPVSKANPHLLHADVGALIARDTFSVNDQDVCSAIANHTLGQPGMNALSCIVFLADSLEPGRGETPELEELRKASYYNLEQAVWLTCDYSLRLLIETHRLIHPRTVATRNWFLQKVKNSQQATDKTA